MTIDRKYYEDKKNQLVQKANNNLQKFITAAFEMVAESNDINERIKEIDINIAENAEKSKELQEKPSPKSKQEFFYI